MLGPEALKQFVNVSDAITRLATAEGIDPDGLIRNQEDINAELQQQQLQQVAQNIDPEQVQQLANQVAQQTQG